MTRCSCQRAEIPRLIRYQQTPSCAGQMQAKHLPFWMVAAGLSKRQSRQKIVNSLPRPSKHCFAQFQLQTDSFALFWPFLRLRIVTRCVCANWFAWCITYNRGERRYLQCDAGLIFIFLSPPWRSAHQEILGVVPLDSRRGSGCKQPWRVSLVLPADFALVLQVSVL